MSKFDQAKMLMQMRKIQKDLQKEIIEVEVGAVKLEVTGEQKLRKIHIDPELVDLDDIGQLEKWVEEAFREAIAESQKVAQEKLKPYLGQLGNLGL